MSPLRLILVPSWMRSYKGTLQPELPVASSGGRLPVRETDSRKAELRRASEESSPVSVTTLGSSTFGAPCWPFPNGG